MARAARPPRFAIWQRIVAAVALAVPVLSVVGLALAVLVACGVIGGCASTTTKAAKEEGTGLLSSLFAPGSAPSFAIVGILASLCLVIAVGSALASIWLPIIPRRAAVTALLLSDGDTQQAEGPTLLHKIIAAALAVAESRKGKHE